MAYVDGFVIPVPADKLDAYKAHSHIVRPGLERTWRTWRRWNVSGTMCLTAPDIVSRAVQAKEDEIVRLFWIVYESCASRDAVMEQVMAAAHLERPFGKR